MFNFKANTCRIISIACALVMLAPLQLSAQLATSTAPDVVQPSTSLAPATATPVPADAVSKSGQIKIVYEPPSNELDKPLFDRLRAHQVLEKLQAFFSPLKLPRPLVLKIQGCNGEADAFYENDVVTVCVETVYDMVRNAQGRGQGTNLDQQTIVLGGFFHIFLHEVSHAIFDYHKIPLLGREEDAADQLAAYVLLNLETEDAVRLIKAAVYLFAVDAGVKSARQLNRRTVRIATADLSGFHSTPRQRLYNILCMAYGANPRLYGVAVKTGALPDERAQGCADEYEQIEHAYRTLIMPHIDLALGRLIKKERWLAIEKTNKTAAN